MSQRVKIFLSGCLMLALAACGGGSNEGFLGTSSSSTSDTGGVTASTSGIRIGNGVGAGFTQGALDVAITGTLSAGGSTSVSASLVDSVGTPYDTATAISFSSTCTSSGLATMDTPVTTSSGVATSTYTAVGCSGTDAITATASVGGQTLTATGSVTVAAAALGSVQFVSATPETISLKGTGGAGLQETSTVRFKVLNESGGPVSGEDVTFALSTDVGGITLTPTTGTTGVDGVVTTVVQSGTVATPVRVLASVTSGGVTIQTQSDQLTISTGIPDQDSVSLVSSIYNPEAWNFDGATAEITVRLADRFNNPVPDGTTANFRTEGGSIGSSCVTVDGACSVTWTSQNPRPTAVGDEANNGLSTVLVYALGEESFVDGPGNADENGNGRFDDGDSFTDMPEVFQDDDFDGTRDAGEPYLDYDGDGSYDAAADGEFNGVLCEHSTLCSSSTSLYVYDTLLMVMSTSGANINITSAALDVSGGGSGNVTVDLSDLNGNINPADTTIAIAVPSGVSVVGKSSFTVPNDNAVNPTTYTFSVEDGDAAEPIATTGVDGSGTITITVTTPNGVETVSSQLITY
jgi:hypothetical protein